MKIKRILSTLLCCVMLFALLPATALADNATSVYVNGVELSAAAPYWRNGDAAASSDSTDYNAFFDTSTTPTPTLRLNNCEAETGYIELTTPQKIRAAIYAYGDITLELKNTNSATIPNTTDHFGIVGLYIYNGSLTVTGDGTLTARGGNSVYTASYGVYAESITVSNGALTAKGGNSDLESSYGIRAGSINISNGTLTAESGTAKGSSFGLYSDGITVMGGTLTAKGGTSNGVGSYGVQAKGIAIWGGTFTAEGGQANSGNSNGVYSYLPIRVSSGTFTATGGTASGDSYGIKVGSGGSVTLTSGTTIAKSGTAAAVSQAFNVQPVFSDIVQPTDDWYQWRRSVSDDCTLSTTEAYVRADIDRYVEISSVGSAYIKITEQPTDQIVTEGQQVTFSVTATSTYPPTYQWQYTDGTGSGWTDIDGMTSASYTIASAPANMNGFKIRCIVSAIDSPKVESNVVTMTVVAPAFIPVTDIDMTSAASVQVNTDLPLAGTVMPANATNNTIEWSLDNANGTGATVSNSGVFHATAAGTATVKAKVTNGAAATTDYDKTFTITVTAAPPAPPFGGYTTPVTVYNDPSAPDATVWLTGSGLPANDLLVTDRLTSGSDYNAMLRLADKDDVFRVYNIYLRSGKSSTGGPMYLHFDLADDYAGQTFTLVHKKADGTVEYFYAAAGVSGDLAFGPLYELSPFMLVKGSLVQAGAVGVPDTGGAACGLWAGLMLMASAMLAVIVMLAMKKRGA